MIQRGWSAKGSRSYAEQAGFRSERLTIIAAYNHGCRKIIAPFEFNGYTNTVIFNQWFEEILCPELKPGQIIVLDNASFHKSSLLKGMAKKVGCEIIYLPPYSPDLNPIEKVWANFKRKLRKVIKKCKNFKEAITLSFRNTLPC